MKVLVQIFCYIMNSVNHNNLHPFLANVSILYPLKTPESQSFLVFSGFLKWKVWPEIGMKVLFKMLFLCQSEWILLVLTQPEELF